MTRTAWTTGVVRGALLMSLVLGLAAMSCGGDDGSGAAAEGDRSVVVRGVTGARAPYDGYTAGTITVGERALEIVVADDDTERITGLRGRRDASPYDGMLFVFDGDTSTAFTMAGVPGPLDIGFFAADGRRVDRLRMEPCSGSDSTCPGYRSAGEFRYALETAPGSMPAGRLRMRVTQPS